MKWKMNDQQEHSEGKRESEHERKAAGVCAIVATVRYALCIRSTRFSRTLSLLLWLLLQEESTESCARPICILHHFNMPANTWFTIWLAYFVLEYV